jgi:hypothetical protein
MARTLADVPAFLLAKAESCGYGEDECWPWPGAKNDKGYGQLRVDGRPQYVHILSHEVFIGPIPEDFEVDHRCHDPHSCAGGPACPHRPCFNFRHLKAVTSLENTRRSTWTARTHCPHGHPYDEVNTGRGKNGRRFCKKCHAIGSVTRKQVQRAERGLIPPKTHCKNGHPFDDANTYITPAGHRKCRACRRDHMRSVHGYRGPVTHCPQGHPYDDQNTYIVPSTGHRQCRACNRDRMTSARSATGG